MVWAGEEIAGGAEPVEEAFREREAEAEAEMERVGVEVTLLGNEDVEVAEKVVALAEKEVSVEIAVALAEENELSVEVTTLSVETTEDDAEADGEDEMAEGDKGRAEMDEEASCLRLWPDEGTILRPLYSNVVYESPKPNSKRGSMLFASKCLQRVSLCTKNGSGKE